MQLIDERDKRTFKRKSAKKSFDARYTLSVKDSPTVRLLDEGAIVDANGNLDFYIKKGTLEKYYNALDPSFVGTINFGHHDFATFPVILGTWTKEDLSLVDIGNGRKGLDVKVNLYEENPLVIALKQMPYTLGVSSEFYYSIDEDATKEYGFLVVDDLNIDAFAIVGEAGNVGSSGLKLNAKGKEMNLKELLTTLNSEGEVNLDKLNRALDKIIDKKEEAVEETEETKEETEEETEETEEETKEESVEETEESEETKETEEESEETEESEESEETEEESETVANLSARVDAIMESLNALKKERDELREELNAKIKAEAEFTTKFKNLTVSLSDEHKEEDTVFYTDGIGE